MATEPDRPLKSQPTMADVAERAGVSTMTVSRALKKGGSISQKTRRKIMDAVDELGYVLDQTAGTLSSKRSNFIAALIPSVNNSNFSDTVHGITSALKDGGLQLLLGYTDYQARAEEEMGDLLFSIAQLSRRLGIEPETALRKADDKFTRRFGKLEQSVTASGRLMKDLTLDELETEWQRLKHQV